MKFQNFSIACAFLLVILMLFQACSSRLNDSSERNSNSIVLANYYRNVSPDSIDYIRILKTDSDVELISGDIFYSSRYITKQIVGSVEHISDGSIKSIEKQLVAQGFRSEFGGFKNVMFIQIPVDSGNSMDAIQARTKLENRLDQEFLKNGCGQWISGDIGEGGANMLFQINNWEKAFQTALAVLGHQNLLEEAIIAKRLNFSETYWNYQIVYPNRFEGEFDTR